MRELDDLFLALSRSKFRAKFRLRDRELAMLQQKGIDTIMQQARKLLATRLVPAEIPNDGKQTPFRNHPVFVAQHATATCCRGCLQKWHQIPRGKELSDEKLEHVLATIRRWLVTQESDREGEAPAKPVRLAGSSARREPRPPGQNQLELFRDAT